MATLLGASDVGFGAVFAAVAEDGDCPLVVRRGDAAAQLAEGLLERRA